MSHTLDERNAGAGYPAPERQDDPGVRWEAAQLVCDAINATRLARGVGPLLTLDMTPYRDCEVLARRAAESIRSHADILDAYATMGDAILCFGSGVTDTVLAMSAVPEYARIVMDPRARTCCTAVVVTPGGPFPGPDGNSRFWVTIVRRVGRDGDGGDGDAEGLLDATNRYRAGHRLPALAPNPKLVAAAREHAEDVARQIGQESRQDRAFAIFVRYGHRGTDDSWPWGRAARHGYAGQVNENVYCGPVDPWFPDLNTPPSIVDAWRQSPGHDRNQRGDWSEFGGWSAASPGGKFVVAAAVYGSGAESRVMASRESIVLPDPGEVAGIAAGLINRGDAVRA